MASSTVSLRIFGDDLEPDELSRLLKCEPDVAHRKGDPVSTRHPEHRRKHGMWSISAPEAESEDYDAQVLHVLSRVSHDKSVWQNLHARYEVDLFCGFFMDTRNQGFSLSTASISLLAEFGISPGFDIYAPTPEEEAEYHAKQEGNAA